MPWHTFPLVAVLALLCPLEAGAQWGVGYDEALDWHVAISGSRVRTALEGDFSLGDALSATPLDAEGLLDLESEDDIAGSLSIQPMRGHLLRFDFVPIRFEGDTTLVADALVDGIPFSVGDRVQSAVDLRRWGLAYRWSFGLGNLVSIGPVIGVDLLEGALSSENLTLAGAPEVEEKVLLPIPLVGLRLEVRPLPRLHLFAEGRGMRLGTLAGIDDVEIVSGEAGLRLLLTEHLAVSGRYRLDDYDFAASDVDFDLRMDGVFLDLEARF